MRELRDLGSLFVDLLRLIGFHLGLEGSCFGRFLQACDGPSPVGRRLLRGALITVCAARAGCLRCSIDMRAHAMFPVQHSVVGESLSGRAEVHIMFRVVGKRISYELARTALRVVLSRLPAILPEP
jgi:hypothetical protein